MQIDFHHTVTYVAARLAGFNPKDADIISTSAQYVDDATSSGIVNFSNGAMYQRICSSHKALDLENLKNEENLLVWLPFHFLPGNGNLEKGQNPTGTFIQKIVCTPNSYIARDMLASAYKDKGTKRELHRIGIAMHIYSDTWAHQGFAGVLHEVNDVDDIKESVTSGVFKKGLEGFLTELVSDATPPIGHGKANILPDLPFLKWSYKDFKGERIERDNSLFFLEAAQNMFIELYKFLHMGSNSVNSIPVFPANDLEQIRNLFMTLKDSDGEKRHQAWINAIGSGKFSFGSEKVTYSEDGRYSWKAEALETSSDLPVHKYTPDFLNSNWKLFHDALQAHRLAVLHDILPNYGICAG